MKRFWKPLFLAMCMLCGPVAFAAAQRPQPGAHALADVSASYGNLPLSFEMNRGQTDRRVEFLARGPGYGLFLTPTEAVLSLRSSHCPA